MRTILFIFSIIFANLCFAQRTIEFKNLRIETLKDWDNKNYYIIGDSTWFFDRTVVTANGKDIECFFEPQIVYRCPRGIGSESYELRLNAYVNSLGIHVPEDPKVYFKLQNEEIIKTTARLLGIGSPWHENNYDGQCYNLRLDLEYLQEQSRNEFIQKIRIEAAPCYLDWYFDNETAADFSHTINEYINIFKEYLSSPKEDPMLEDF